MVAAARRPAPVGLGVPVGFCLVVFLVWGWLWGWASARWGDLWWVWLGAVILWLWGEVTVGCWAVVTVIVTGWWMGEVVTICWWWKLLLQSLLRPAPLDPEVQTPLHWHPLLLGVERGVDAGSSEEGRASRGFPSPRTSHRSGHGGSWGYHVALALEVVVAVVLCEVMLEWLWRTLQLPFGDTTSVEPQISSNIRMYCIGSA